MYRYRQNQYDGCINRRTPGRYVTTVPDNDLDEFFEDDDDATRSNTRRRKPKRRRVRKTFWCGTEVDGQGNVRNWGKYVRQRLYRTDIAS